MAKKASTAAVKLNMSAPWQIYRNKIAALFEGDNEIEVKQIGKDRVLVIEVVNETKAAILEDYLPKTVTFGNVTIGIQVWIKEIDNDTDKIAYLLKDTKNFIGLKVPEKKKIGSIKPFACFIPEVVQFFADDLSDPNGKFNGLMADIAKEVLVGAKKYVYFSTARKIESLPVRVATVNL